ncbi:hypothetical protein P7C70_g326, partial [Phenoliferia sp. Uapishka_3]
MLIISDITGVRSEKHFDASQIPSQDGKCFICTGGHAGIGLSTTKGLLQAGAKVYIASRNPEKVDAAIKELLAEHADWKDRIGFLEIDLASLKSAKKAGEEFLGREQRLDGIVLNAGVMAVPYKLTEDGVEQSFQVNHLSHWLLFKTLLPLLESTGIKTGHPSRVINLSSFAHNFISAYPFASASFKSLDDVNRKFDAGGWIRYSQAKLSAILFSREINKRCGPNVQSIAVHPGFVASALYDHLAFMKPMMGTFITVEEGAISSLYALTSPEVEEKNLWGSYLVPFAKVKATTAYGNDPKLASDLWDLCEKITAEKTA